LCMGASAGIDEICGVIHGLVNKSGSRKPIVASPIVRVNLVRAI
jgi:hypothetical protein